MDILAEPTCSTEVNKSCVAVIYYQDRGLLHVSLSLIAVATLVLKTCSSAFPLFTVSPGHAAHLAFELQGTDWASGNVCTPQMTRNSLLFFFSCYWITQVLLL